MVSQKMENEKPRAVKKIPVQGRFVDIARAAAALAAFLCLTPAFFSSGCSPRADDTLAAAPSETIENFKLRQTREGKTVWELVARTARFATSDEVALADPVLSLPIATGGKNVIKSARGRAVISTSEVETFGPTTLTSPEKTIYTSDIRYIPSEDKIVTDKKVLIVTDDSEITGASMVSDSRLESIVLTDQNVKWKTK